MSQTKKILLIEDDTFLARAYGDGLKHAGFDVSVINDGTKAVEGIRKLAPNLVLLDIVMPRKNGFEVLEEMKLDTELQKIPVVILSSLGQQSDIDKGRALGAVDYLVKTNWTLKQMVEKVKEHLVKAEKPAEKKAE